VQLFEDAGLTEVKVRPIDVPTHFQSFEDFWTLFEGRQGPAPGYVASLPAPARQALLELLRRRLPTEPDGSIRLTARAWAGRGSLSRAR
jgi:hypothetical protein